MVIISAHAIIEPAPEPRPGPTGIPLFYELDENLKPITKGGRYLDPVAAQAAIQAVANQGKR